MAQYLNTADRRPSQLWLQWSIMPSGLKIGVLILLVHALVAVTGPFWTPFSFSEMRAGPPLSGISWRHLFGTDQLGRDVFSRVVYGSHIVILLSLSGTVLALIIGAPIGLLSGYMGGWIDEVIQRLLETMISIPFLILALIAVVAAGPGLSGNPAVVALVIALVYAPRMARMARAASLDIINRDFVTVAMLRGESAWSVVRRELLPNATGVLLVEFALRAGYAPVLVGTLGFLGFGIRPPAPEWGLMISESRSMLLASPVIVLGPSLALASLVIGLCLVAEGVARILGRNVRRSDK